MTLSDPLNSFLRKTDNFNCGIYIYIYIYESIKKDDRESWSILPPHKNDNFYDNMCSVAGCEWPDNSPSWVWRIRGLYSRNWMVSGWWIHYLHAFRNYELYNAQWLQSIWRRKKLVYILLVQDFLKNSFIKSFNWSCTINIVNPYAWCKRLKKQLLYSKSQQIIMERCPIPPPPSIIWKSA